MDTPDHGPLNPATIAAAHEFLPSGELVGWQLLVELGLDDPSQLYVSDGTYREIEGALLRYAAGARTGFPLSDYGSLPYRVNGIDVLLVAQKAAPQLIIAAPQLRSALNFDPFTAGGVVVGLATIVGTIFQILTHAQTKKGSRKGGPRRDAPVAEAKIEERREDGSRLVIAIARSLPPRQPGQSFDDYVALIEMLYPVNESQSGAPGGHIHGRMR